MKIILEGKKKSANEPFAWLGSGLAPLALVRQPWEGYRIAIDDQSS